MFSRRAFSLVELLVVLAIFLLVGVLIFYLLVKGLRWVGTTAGEVKAEVDTTVNTELLVFDLTHAGYGIAKNETRLVIEFFNGTDYPSPLAAIATADDLSDGEKVLVLRETVNLAKTSIPTYGFLVSNGSGIVYAYPPGADWESVYCAWLSQDRACLGVDNCTDPPPGSAAVGYPLDNQSACRDATDPWCCVACNCTTIVYKLYEQSGSSKPSCIPGVLTFGRKTANMSVPLINCVSDWSVWFGLDLDGDGEVDTWENQIPNGEVLTNEDLKKVKVVKVFFLVQASPTGDPGYDFCKLTGAKCDGAGACGEGFLEVAELGGKKVCLKHPEDPAWKTYRWRVVEVTVSNFPNLP
ncbi:MAG: prepilin-type N-terminal cleavage/methylation domain-containing protein [Aquificae bacterium]|nr:prepilin-type N-terminal cleavage/methylation domain-containing protein [Aquificota bacterium]